MAVGALEPQFYAQLIEKLGEKAEDIQQFDFEEGRLKLAEIFASKTQQEWTDVFDGSDACVTPVVDLEEAHLHPQNKARKSFVEDCHGKFSPVSFFFI